MMTVVSRDGSYSAHYENTILITDDEPKILSVKHGTTIEDEMNN